MSSFADDPYMTPGKIAGLMHISPGTVKKWIDDGTLPGIRLPARKGRTISHRRVLKADVEKFMRVRNFARRVSENLVLLVGCEVSEPDGLEVIVAESSFAAGSLVSVMFPRYIVVGWSIGRIEASQIAGGIKELGGYSPVMVAVSPANWQGDPYEFLRFGYSYSSEVVTGSLLRKFLSQSSAGVADAGS